MEFVLYLPSFGHTWDTSWDEVVGQESSNTDHSKTSILQFFDCHGFLSFGIHFVPLSGPVNTGWAVSGEGFALQFGLVFDAFNDAAKENELGPPLGVGLQNGLDGVRGGHVLAIKGANELGPEPANVGQHGGTAIGEFGLAQKVGRDPLGQAHGIVL